MTWERMEEIVYAELSKYEDDVEAFKAKAIVDAIRKEISAEPPPLSGHVIPWDGASVLKVPE
jgi:glycine cleavage system H lipoate-binding protein